jgi:hypothetical protein
MNVWCVCACVFLSLCCPLFRYRPCDELITRPRSPTVCKMIKKLINQPYAPKWKQALKWEGARGGEFIFSHNKLVSLVYTRD